MALTSNDLQAISELLDKKLENTKQDVKRIVTSNNRIFATLLKVELASTTKEIIKVIKVGFQEVENQKKRLEQHLRLAKN